MNLADLSLNRDGVEAHRGAGLAQLQQLEALVGGMRERPGRRLGNVPNLAALLTTGPIAAVVRNHLDRPAKPVRAILFDKTKALNWTLGWHQDRVIAVREQLDVAGFGPWTNKQGQLHVAPPISLIERMITLRIHLDPVDHDNAPLDVALGSHRLGYVAEGDLKVIVAGLKTTTCSAERGDVWAYATPIIHRSSPSQTNRRRRVLQVDYSSDELPGGLRWVGI